MIYAMAFIFILVRVTGKMLVSAFEKYFFRPIPKELK